MFVMVRVHDLVKEWVKERSQDTCWIAVKAQRAFLLGVLHWVAVLSPKPSWEGWMIISFELDSTSGYRRMALPITPK